MKKIFVVLLGVISVFVETAWSADQMLSGENEQSLVCLKEHCFDVEIVQTQKDRQKGLQNRKILEMNKGM